LTWYKKREKKDMFEELKEMICEYVDVEPGEIREDSRFVEDLGFNSYDFMSMVGEIEEHWDVEVDEREVVNVKTVKDAMEYIQSLQQAV
jgi:acyl carrier protein